MKIDNDKLRGILAPLAAILDDLEEAGLKAAGNEHIRVLSYGDVMFNVGHLRDARELLRQLDDILPAGPAPSEECPNCGDDRVDGESVDFDSDYHVATQDRGCTECGCTWTAVYRLEKNKNIRTATS